MAEPQRNIEPAKKGCLARNWKWMLGVGCLGIVVVCGGGFGAIFYGGIKLAKSSDVYQESLAAAQSDPTVERELGTPVTDGFMFTGSININNGYGKADLAIPLSGPKGSGSLHVAALKNPGGPWTYSTFDLTTPSKQVVSLPKPDEKK